MTTKESPRSVEDTVSRLFESAVGQVEVGRVVGAVLGLLPAADNRPAVVVESAGEALRERLAVAPELPLAVADAHLVHATNASIVGVELVVRPVGRVASND